MPDEITFKPRTAANRHVEDQATIDALRARVAELEAQIGLVSDEELQERARLEHRVEELRGYILAARTALSTNDSLGLKVALWAPILSMRTKPMNHQTGIHFCRWCCWLRVRGYGLAITPTPGDYRGLRRIARPRIVILTPAHP